MRKLKTVFAGLLALILCFIVSASIGEGHEEACEYAVVRTDGYLDRLNVRFTPNEEFPAFCKLWNGVRVRVESRENGWTFIRLGNDETIAQISGYVQEKYLDFGLDTAENFSTCLPRVKVTKEAFYIASLAYYYPFPANDNCLLPAGTELTVLGVKGNYDETDETASFDAFFMLDDSGEMFWLRSMEQFGIEVLNPPGLIAKTSASVRFRKGPDKESKVLRTLDTGKTVDVLLRGEGWTMVKYRSEIGYIMSRYLVFP